MVAPTDRFSGERSNRFFVIASARGALFRKPGRVDDLGRVHEC